MKKLSDMVLLGDQRLYEVCKPIEKLELSLVTEWVADLDNVMKEIRIKYNFGRAIAAPQLGIMKRLIRRDSLHHEGYRIKIIQMEIQ